MIINITKNSGENGASTSVIEVSEEHLDSMIGKLVGLFDLKKFIEYGQVYIENNDGIVSITGYDGDYKNTTVVDIDAESMAFSNSDNEAEIRAMCGIARALRNYLDIDSNKYADFRFCCGLEPNSDKEIEKLDKVVTHETREKLWDAGYEIIKRPD